jgi:N-methylhydantoinase A
VTTLGVCFLHSYADPSHERAMREVLRREHPDAVVSLSCDVLREYREYERSITTLVDAAVKPRVSRYVAGIRRRLDAPPRPGVPFWVMKSNGGCCRPRRSSPADHDGAVRARPPAPRRGLRRRRGPGRTGC